MSGTLRLRGATSGYSELQAPAVAADQTFVLPTAGGTLLTTDSPISKLTLQLGSASQPSLTFEGDTDTGLYSGGTNTLNLVTGGSDRLVIDSAGNVGIGTSPSDKLHISGSNTGGFRFTNADNSNAISVFMRGGNAIANTTDDAVLSLGQRSNVSLITTGNVGIGTTSPGKLLSIQDSTAPSLALYTGSTIRAELKGTTALTTLLSYSNSPITFNIGGSAETEAVRIDGSGNVGIGTASAGDYLASAHQLVISDAASTGLTIATPSSSSGTIAFADGTGAADNARGLIRYGHSDNSLQFSTNATEAMRIDSSGNVGIGNTAPGYKLSVLTTGASDTSLHLATTAGGGSNGEADNSIRFTGGTNSRWANAKYEAFFHLFYGNGVERMRLSDAGQLLIGTTAASRSTVTTRLSAYASDNQWMCMDIGATQSNDTGGIYGVRSRSSSHNPIALASAYESTTAVTCYFGGGWGGFGRSANELRFYTSAALDNAAGTTGNERMRIDSDGNVAIGVNSAPRKLSIMEGAYEEKIVRISGPDQSSEYLSLGVESGVSTIQAGGVGSFSNSLAFKTASSGVESERMRIDSSGQVNVFASATPHISRSGTSAGTVQWLYAGAHSATSTSNGTVSFLVYTNGNVQNTNDQYGQISDIKLKENIVDAGSQWDDFKAVRFRKYNFKEETGYETHTQLGVIAQELELTSPGLVYETPDRDEEGNVLSTTTKAVKSSILTKKGLVALQEAMERIESLETRIATLENN